MALILIPKGLIRKEAYGLVGQSIHCPSIVQFSALPKNQPAFSGQVIWILILQQQEARQELISSGSITYQVYQPAANGVEKHPFRGTCPVTNTRNDC